MTNLLIYSGIIILIGVGFVIYLIKSSKKEIDFMQIPSFIKLKKDHIPPEYMESKDLKALIRKK